MPEREDGNCGRADMQRLCSMVALLVVLAPWIVSPVGGKLAARYLLLSPGVWLPSQINGSAPNAPPLASLPRFPPVYRNFRRRW